MTTASAVIFDMDGTLTDSETTWDVVRRRMATDEGRPWPATATTDMMGMCTPEWAEYLATAVGLKGTPTELADRTIGALAKAYAAGQVPLLPGAVDAVARLARVVPLAVASSSPPVLIDAGLAALGVSDLVGLVVSSEEVGRGKPAPDVYLEACLRLGVHPQQSVAVEDSSSGIRSAHAAGMKVVAIPPHFHPPSDEILALADVVLDSLDELTPELVASLFA